MVFDWVSISLSLVILSFVVLFFVRPLIAVYFFFAVKFTVDLFWDHPIILGLNADKILGGLWPFLCLYYVVRYKAYQISRWPYFKILMVWLIFNAVSAVWGYVTSYEGFRISISSPLTVKAAFDWYFKILNQVGALMIMPLIVKEPEEFKNCLKCVIVSLAIPIFLGGAQLFLPGMNFTISTMFSSGGSGSQILRIAALYHDAGTFAMAMFVGLMAASLLLLFAENISSKLFLLALMMILCVLIYFSFSRTIWISAIFMWGLFFLLYKKYKYLIVLASLLVLTAVLFPRSIERFQKEIDYILGHYDHQFEEGFSGSLGAGRVWLWNSAYNHYLSFDPVSKIIGQGSYFGSHNQYIAILLRNGIIGVIIFVGFISKIYRELQRRFRQKEKNENRLIIFSSALYILVMGVTQMFSQPLDNASFSIVFWFIIGYAITHLPASPPTPLKSN
jgi:hypothetical protein